jgi:hypothetical protein
MSITFTTLDKPGTDITRDRWGRPLITPIDGGKPVPYTRVSTLAKALDDKTALMKWKQRQTAIGLSRRPDLVNMAAAVSGEPKRIDEIVEQAMVAAESERAANVGTTLHALTEVVDQGQWPEHLDASLAPDLRAYQSAMSGIEIMAMEQFIVADEVQAAGTFDRLVRLPDGRIMVADIKTGQHEPKYPHASTIQIAVYAHGHLYDADKGRVAYLPDLGVSVEGGLLIHLPAGQGKCDLYELDIATGWQLARTAVMVRNIFKAKPLKPYAPSA